MSTPVRWYPASTFIKKPAGKLNLLFSSLTVSNERSVIFSLIDFAKAFMASISNKFTGKAMVIFLQPSDAKYLAISTDETVILSIPSFLNHRPTAKDWWVLKCGLKISFFFSALACMLSIFCMHLFLSRMSVGLVICILFKIALDDFNTIYEKIQEVVNYSCVNLFRI